MDTEMSPWAYRRKVIFLGILILLMAVAGAFIFWFFFYQAPSCSDGKQNGDETGIDCGGSCSKVCSGEAITPIVKWDPQIFQVFENTWSVVVYVENPNTNLNATYLPYTFTLYDASNNILATRTSATILPKNDTVGIFEGSIVLDGNKIPKRATFEIGGEIVWSKTGINEKKDITVTYSPLSQLETKPRIEAVVKNNTDNEIKNIELVAVVFDGSDNAVAASRTLVDSIKKGDSTNIVFTWPRPFSLGSKVCEKNSDIMLLLDRSGSMAASSSDPLIKAKQAAESFVDSLGSKNQVGMISFATDISNPIDLNLVSNFDSAKKAIDSISIATSSTQYTNIYAALHGAFQELVSARANDDHSKIMILLTDGDATYPKNPNSHTESDDIKYAENVALGEASSIKQSGITIYTIGLGSDVNASFLKNIASTESDYYFAPTTSDLAKIYENISSDICNEIPARIEITYKIFDGLN